nr:hypothetical protein Iba_scaffold63971CG0010 [Ipomoea batatas]GMD31924.1 hypothetical protein Iba_chr09bCG3410 [Ipomoea batatas]GMD36842.1 hypothetical protein Iba_chr09eCG3760 [Ipomoea batatas]GMD38419.1 hypothetical protein Iba_chr09fCG3760 [Ipomoea batatas]
MEAIAVLIASNFVSVGPFTSSPSLLSGVPTSLSSATALIGLKAAVVGVKEAVEEVVWLQKRAELKGSIVRGFLGSEVEDFAGRRWAVTVLRADIVDGGDWEVYAATQCLINYTP